MDRLLDTPADSPQSLVLMFVQQMAIGAAAGYGFGRLSANVINWLRLEYEGLYPVLTTALGGNGFLAVYLGGLMAGNNNFVHKASLRRFHAGLAWLSFVEKSFISWVGLREAVPIILATFPLLAGLSKASTIFNLVFFIVLTSVLVQGTTLPLEFTPSVDIKSELAEFSVPEKSPVAGRQLVNIDFPAATLVVLLGRNDEFIVPSGNTRLEPGDFLLVLADHLNQVRTVIDPPA